MTRFVGTVPTPLNDMWPRLDSLVKAQGWVVSPSSTIYKRFYDKSLSMWTSPQYMTVYLEGDHTHTRLTVDLNTPTLGDMMWAKKRIAKFFEGLGGTLVA